MRYAIKERRAEDPVDFDAPLGRGATRDVPAVLSYHGASTATLAESVFVRVRV